MRRGNLRHTVAIEYPIKTADGQGGFTNAWHVFARRNASIWGRKSDESIQEGKVVHVALWNVRVDYVEGLKTGYRLNLNGTVFEILSSMPVDFKKRYTDMVCRVIE